MLRRLFAITTLLATLSACATREIPRIVDTSCTAFKSISYAIPPVDKRETDANVYDTPATVEEVQAHNARYDKLCTSKPASP